MFRAVPLALPLFLTACAGLSEDVPSLLPRPVEGVDFAEPTRVAPTAAPDPQLDTEVAGQRTALASAARTFERAVDAAERPVARAEGQAPGSERWIEGQLALATLDVARTEIEAPRAALERMALDRAVEGLPPYPALDQAVADAVRIDAAQRARIATLTARLR